MTRDPPAIDIHRRTGLLEQELERTRNDDRILEPNRETICRFIRDARVGRTVQRGAKRRLSETRCLKLLTTLRRFAMELPVPFETVTPEIMERFDLGMEDGTVRKLNRTGQTGRYSAASVLDSRKIIRKFYRWLLPDDAQRVDELTGWFDMQDRPPQLRTFGRAEAERMAQAIGSVQGRALVMMLFDGGFRAGELFNVRMRDLQFRESAPGESVCYVRIRVSKTRPRTISLPLATDAVRFWVERHPEGGRINEQGLIDTPNPDATVLTWTYHYCRKVIAKVGQQELKERVYLHRFRHASATYYAKLLSHYQLTARFGWTMGSRAVQRYIDHSGVLADEVTRVVRREREASARFAENSGSSVEELIRRLKDRPDLLNALLEAVR